MGTRKSNYWHRTLAKEEQKSHDVGFHENPIKMYEDGSLKASKFIDKDDRDISFTEFKAKDGVEGYYFERPLDNSTSVQFIPTNVHKIFN